MFFGFRVPQGIFGGCHSLTLKDFENLVCVTPNKQRKFRGLGAWDKQGAKRGQVWINARRSQVIGW
eukprot:2236452-Amphidinium_carterae.1